MKAFIIFFISYCGMAVGKVPGLVIDRVGVALLGAIAMVAWGVVTPGSAVGSIDLPTLLLLYALMIVSAQLRLGGFYTWVAVKLVSFLTRPKLFLLIMMLASAFLSAMLANDIVCFAFTPVLALSLIEARLNPLPFLIGLAVASNIGSAATIIGNPQNMLIGQVGGLDFAEFFLWCGPPTVLALLAGYFIILGVYRENIYSGHDYESVTYEKTWPAFNTWQTAKGLAAVSILVGLFFTSIPREISAICIAGLLLCSRKMKTRDILGLIDWHLLTLFCSLFIIIHGISQGDLLSVAMARLSEAGIHLQDLFVLTGITAVLSNLVSNVPAVMLLIHFLDKATPVQWYTLAAASTFAGNLFILGSIANLIVIEQAGIFGIKITFKQHAAVGIPVTIVSLIVLIAWIFAMRS